MSAPGRFAGPGRPAARWRRAARRWLRPRLRRAWERLSPATFALRARPDDRELGRVGEELAARALGLRGLRPVGRRLRTPAAEVDVVAVDGALLVVVEVKTGRVRSAGAGAPTWRPADRLRRPDRARLAAAARWLAGRRGARRWRVDVVEVRIGGIARPVEVLHLPGAAAPTRA